MNDNEPLRRLQTSIPSATACRSRTNAILFAWQGYHLRVCTGTPVPVGRPRRLVGRGSKCWCREKNSFPRWESDFLSWKIPAPENWNWRNWIWSWTRHWISIGSKACLCTANCLARKRLRIYPLFRLDNHHLQNKQQDIICRYSIIKHCYRVPAGFNY